MQPLVSPQVPSLRNSINALAGYLTASRRSILWGNEFSPGNKLPESVPFSLIPLDDVEVSYSSEALRCLSLMLGLQIVAVYASISSAVGHVYKSLCPLQDSLQTTAR